MDRVNREMPAEETLFDLAELFKIFGDSTRIKILYVLFESEMCVCDIAQLLGMTQSAISHQLQVLKKSKLVKYRREGKTVFYSLADSPCPRHFGPGHGARHRVTPHCKGVFCHEKNLQTHGFRLRQLRRQNGECHQEDRRVSDASVSFLAQKLTVEADAAALTTSSSRLSRPAKGGARLRH